MARPYKSESVAFGVHLFYVSDRLIHDELLDAASGKSARAWLLKHFPGSSGNGTPPGWRGRDGAGLPQFGPNSGTTLSRRHSARCRSCGADVAEHNQFGLDDFDALVSDSRRHLQFSWPVLVVAQRVPVGIVSGRGHRADQFNREPRRFCRAISNWGAHKAGWRDVYGPAFCWVFTITVSRTSSSFAKNQTTVQCSWWSVDSWTGFVCTAAVRWWNR